MTKESGNFLRKVAKFVANPATDWSVIDSSTTAEGRDSEHAKAEIKAMIERKRRNDFVRKRELDMLRRIRREGLSYDSAMAFSTPSNLDLETRPGLSAPSNVGVKDKIDAIEKQMVGGDTPRSHTRPVVPPPPIYASDADTTPATLLPEQNAAPSHPAGHALGPSEPLIPKVAAPVSLPPLDFHMESMPLRGHPPETLPLLHVPMPVQEVVHDPELDEAVIAFANADFDACEDALLALIGEQGLRADNRDTWMALFDFYRALDKSARFETLAVNFVNRFGMSPPQWYSLPERVSVYLSRQKPAPAAKQPAREGGGSGGQPLDEFSANTATLEGWVAPDLLDADAMAQLRGDVLQLPRPWVMDWSHVQQMTPEGAHVLTQQLRQWAQEDLQMTWVGVERLIELLREFAPAGNRDVDPAFWMLHIELLRLCNRPDQFDEIAIDYCVTYELSPPSWENTRCRVKLLGDAAHTQHVSISHVGDLSTNFAESLMHPDVPMVQLASLDLSGQLVGDISGLLEALNDRLGESVAVELDCAYLLRVDFIAAGDLLNWVQARSDEGRTVAFLNPHRLVAAFFGAMGITEQARVRLQQV